MNRCQHFISVIALTIFVTVRSALSAEPTVPNIDSPPAEIVRYVLDLNVDHGPERTNQLGRDLMSQLRSRPSTFAFEIAPYFKIPDNDILESRAGAASDLYNCIYLAEALGPDYGTPLVHQLAGAVSERLAQLRSQEAVVKDDAERAKIQSAIDFLMSVFQRILDGASKRYDNGLIVSAIEQLKLAAFEPRRKYTNTFAAQVMMYLGWTHPEDSRLYERLRQVIEDERSCLKNDSVVIQGVRAYERQAVLTKK